MIHFPSFPNSQFHSLMAFKPGGGKKSSERKAAFSPPPGPPPLFWPRLSCKKMPQAFSTNWDVSLTKESELGKASLFPKKYLRPTQNLFSATRPNTNQMPSGICTAKRRWGSKGLGPRGRGRGRTTIHPFREGFASPKRCKTASDLPTTRDPRRDRS